MSVWGARIKQLREGRGWNKAELARRVGVSGPTITQWESGVIKEIEGSKLAKVALVFETTMDDVWGRKTNKAATRIEKLQAETDFEIAPRVQHEADLLECYRGMREDAKDTLWAIITVETKRLISIPWINKMLDRVSRQERLKQDKFWEKAQQRAQTAKKPVAAQRQ